MRMRLLIRSTGCPVPSAVEADSEQTLQELLGQLRQSGKLEGACDERLRVVHRGRVLRQRSAQLSEVCSDGDVLVLLPGRPAAAPCPPSGPPSKGPGLRDINAAIREDLAAQGPGPLAAAEAAARRQEVAAVRSEAGAATGAARLEDLLLSGEMGALREYLEQLQEALRGPAEAGPGGAGGGGGGGGAGNLAAALDAFFGLPLAGQVPGGGGGAAGPGGQAAAGSLADAPLMETDEEEEDGDLSDEEEEDEDEDDAEGEFSEGEEEYSEEEEDGDEHAVGAAGQPGAQLLPPRVPELDAATLGGLMEMGFPEALCRNALLWGRNRFEPALEWLLSHAEDPAAAEPLSDAQLARLYGRGPPRQAPAVDEGSLAHLADMGFDRVQAEQALRAFNNSLPAAASWLLSLGSAAAAAGAAAQPPGAVPAAVPAAPPATAGSVADGVSVLGDSGGSDSQRPEEREPSSGRASSAGSGGSRHSGLPEAAGTAQQEDDGMPALRSDASGSDVSAEALSDDASSEAVPRLAASSDGASISSGDSADEWEEALAQS